MEFPNALTDRYHLASHLARGGMADVYQGQDTLLGRRVAVKMLHAQYSNDEAFVKRFRREAQAAANLAHPNIVGIYDWGQADTTYFIVMELVDGRSMRDVLRSEGALLPRRAAEIGLEVASALSAAHRAGLVHRDIKPGNILLATNGSVKVTDFGIARAWDDSQELTRTGAVIGTATYFSPEQAQGAPADERSDVYSLGVVMYEMLSGRPPFSGDSPVAVAYQHVSATASPPSSINPDVPPEMDAVVMRAMQKEPALRYQTAEELRADLAKVLAGQTPTAVPVTVAAAAVAPMAVAGGDHGAATRVLPAQSGTSQLPTQTSPTLEDRGPSQVPFILTAFGLLGLLGVLVFLVFQLAANRTPAEGQVTVPNVVNMDRATALATLQLAGLRVDVREEASDTVPELTVIRTDPVAGQLVDPDSLVIVYLSEGAEQFAVPQLVGQTEVVAVGLIEEARFVVGSVTRRPDPNAPAGQVIEQTPVAGVELSAGTPINLVVSQGPLEFALAEYSNQEENTVFAALAELGLRWNTRQENSDSVPDGTVIRTEPVAGTMVKAGDIILLIVSSGRGAVAVPDVFGRTENAARDILEEAGFQMRVEVGRQAVTDPDLDDRVVRQFPDAGTQAQPGSVVTVTLGEFTAPTTTTTTTSTTTTTTASSTTTPCVTNPGGNCP
ncbi:MAG: Stk1 family PASTA domain-containing Ser/Thr kinase [Acidimicrobiia bacterium]